MSKEKQVYVETYGKPYPTLLENKLPILRHLPENFKCTEARLMKTGTIERDGKTLGFQDYRLIIEDDDSNKKEEFEKFMSEFDKKVEEIRASGDYNDFISRIIS